MKAVKKLNLLTFEQKEGRATMNSKSWCGLNVKFFLCSLFVIPFLFQRFKPWTLMIGSRFINQIPIRVLHSDPGDQASIKDTLWKRETRERHENAYHGLRLREEECAKWNAPNWTWTWVRLCFRDHSQKTNVYTRQFVPEIISSQVVLFQGRQWSAIEGQLVLERIWAFFSLEREESSRRKRCLH